MALTDVKIRQAKAGDKVRVLGDGQGLFLEIMPTGRKRWRLRFQRQGKRTMLSMGGYPELGLKEARIKASEIRKAIAQGEDPVQARQAERDRTQGRDTFEAVAREWHQKMSAGKWTRDHAQTVLRRLEYNIFDHLGSRPINEITAPELLKVIRRIESRGAIETAHRVRQVCGQVFRYAVASGKAERDPAADIRGALPPVTVRNLPTITDTKEIGALLRAIDAFSGTFTVLCALRLAPLVALRPGELRHGEWSEIDLDTAEWRIPAEKMKARRPHIVPLSRQALTILRELHPTTGTGRYIFPSIRTSTRPMSENTVNAALRRLGYSPEEMCGHGFRSMFSTILNEEGWNPDAIERQLAHVDGNSVRAAYNHAQYLDERRRIMQHWADLLDGLKTGAKVVPLHKVGNT